MSLEQNFNIISNWNGDDNLSNLLVENDKKYDNFYMITNQNYENHVDNELLRLNPIIEIFLNLGFKVEHIISYYNITIENYFALMRYFLYELDRYGLINSNHEIEDINWLNLRSNNTSDKTNGQVISILLKKSHHDIGITGAPLRATFKQLFFLHCFIKKPWYRQMKYQLTHNSQFDKFNFYQIFFTNYLNLDLMGSNHDNDLNERVDVIVNKILDIFNSGKSCGRILTLDGHGRFIKKLFERLCSYSNNFIDNDYLNFVNSIKLRVCDMNTENHRWHENTLPTNYGNLLSSSYYGNIFDANELNNLVEDNGILYLNFNGLGGNYSSFINTLKIFRDNNLTNNVIVSFSNSVNRDFLNELLNIGMKYATAENSKLVTLIF